MTPTDHQPRLLDPSVQAIFHDFAVPLAAVRPFGELAFTNPAFDAAYLAGEFTADRWLQLIRDSLDCWHTATLANRSGGSVAVRVQTLAIDDWYLVAVEELTANSNDALLQELVALQARVRELERASATDHLTGLWNRSHLDRTISSELSRARRYQQALTLILLDVDHFKSVNDSYGHAVGDEVLRELAQRVRATVRASDIAFRWGGEEFVVLAAGTGYRAGERLAEKLRSAVAEREFPVVGAVTISLGVAELDSDEDAAAWFVRLDQQLYRAKHDGRNRVVTDPRGHSNRLGGEVGAMPLRLVWMEAYESGHPLVDSQHLHMFELTNQLIDAVLGRGGSAERRDSVLGELLDHIRAHFADEEALLEAVRYPQLQAHRKAHGQLLARALELREQVAQGAANAGMLVEFLARDVVSRHILAMDRDFFPLLAAAPRA